MALSDGSCRDSTPPPKGWNFHIDIGSRVVVTGGRKGVLRFVGPTEFAKGEWVGVELDCPEDGRTDGSVNDVRYFTRQPLHGLFTRKTQIHSENPPPATISPPSLGPRSRPHLEDRYKRKRQPARRSLVHDDVVFKDVLLNPSLIMKIQQFQTGLFEDLLPRYAEWRAFQKLHTCFRYGIDVPPRYQCFFDMRIHIQDLYLPSMSDRRFVLHVAIYEGDLFVVKRCYQCLQDTIASPQALNCAARYGHLHIVEYIHRHRNQDGCTTAAMDDAATHGHLPIVQFLTFHRTEGCTTRAMDGAAKNGYLDIVQFLHTHRNEGCTHVAMNAAAEHGHLEIVDFLHRHRSEGCTIDAMDFATQNGHLDVVEYLHWNRSEGCSVDALNWAAEGGHLELVHFLNDHRHEGCTVEAMDMAAQNGYIDIVEFLHENRSEGCTTAAMDFAAAQGHMDVVEFLHVNRREGCTADALIWAAQNGHLEIVQFLWIHRGQDVRRHVTLAIRAAARHDQIEVQQYLEFQQANQ
ncbi:hypothetical protein LEN26_001095 [Aphanomyces euteiches]|nr:hypothetical protein AeMF1_003334 [Aphanomyces euteiches]KAH9162089.1 hypothetical protein LEN26_001095 [Aphanomyces euteiches]KAH9190684.1 hypothetical protein AeNC1_007341 [Aphanomyces euteiches]